MVQRRFLDNGSSLSTIVPIRKNHSSVKFQNPEKLTGQFLSAGSLARIHSCNRGVYMVWVHDKNEPNTIILEVPLQFMGQYFRQHQHNLVPHFA